MSGLMNLEGDVPATIVGPGPTAEAPPPESISAPPASPPAPAPAVEEEPEPQDVVTDAAGRKLVPLDALRATRQELKTAKQLASAAEQMREAAQRGEQLGQFFQTIEPLLAKLRARPDIVANIMGAPAEAPPPASHGQPQADPAEVILPKQDAEDLARTLELYTPEGLPDLARARKVALMMRGTARQEAYGAIAPIAQTTAQQQSVGLQQQYAQVRDKAGRTVNHAVLQQLWNIVPPEVVARDPNVAGVLYYAAKGYAAHHGLDEPLPAARAPITSEAPGGRPTSVAATLSELDRHIQQSMQTTEKNYAERAARYRPGAINILE